MSQRIFELADQASTQWMGGAPCTRDGYPITRQYNDDFAILFAELIVQECALISRTSADGFSAARRMEERFGVK